jgi:G6PDH family F420-dependent oxidoreductase
MIELGYALSSEEHRPDDLVKYAKRAEDSGFTFALISDHYHPWIDKQGHSPFVWTVLGAIAQATRLIQIGTGVTCPIIRIHPAIIAQAAATVATMMPGRFFLGLGTGENLNEHVVGEGWPAYDIRAEMLEEAVYILRLLWEGGTQSHYGDYYTVENARIYTLPDSPPPIMIAAGGENSAELASQIGDGLISTSPDAKLVETFSANGTTHGQSNRPRYGQITVCCAEDEKRARKIAHETWPTAGLHGTLNQELPTPAHFEQAVKNVTEENIAEAIICGNKAQRHLDAIQEYVDAGFDHIYFHQVGADQEAFFQFYTKEIIPALKEIVSG